MARRQAGQKPNPSLKNSKQEELFNAFHVLSASVVDYYHCLKKARAQFHREELPDPKWNIMTILEHSGPQTVPHMARSRKLSRQSIQNTVNLLYADGYVDFTENPAHKKSPLVCLTPKGEALSDEMNRSEKEIISKVHIDTGSDEMLKAAKVLQALRTFFESEQWQAVLEKSGRK